MKKQFLFLVLFTSLAAYGQELAVQQVNAPEQVPFAQAFEAHVLLSHPQGQTVELVPDSVPPEFEVTSAQFQPVNEAQTQADLQIVPFTLQASTFTAQFALTQDPQITTVAQAAITVTPVKLFDDNELREIRPPHKIFDWALWLCILLALFAIICLIIFWVRRMNKKTRGPLAAPVDNRPAHVIALGQIDALLDSGLWEQKQYKAFYITLSDILRTYLQRAFGLDVSADTSVEMLRHIKTVAPLVPLTQTLRTFLASGDLVKFAKAVPSPETRNRDITLLREIIHQTTPKPVQPAPQAEVKL